MAGVGEEDVAIMDTVKASCLLNLAASLLQEGEWDDVIHYCSAYLAVDRTSAKAAKALFRRGKVWERGIRRRRGKQNEGRERTAICSNRPIVSFSPISLSLSSVQSAKAHAQCNDFPAARLDLEAAVGLSPGDKGIAKVRRERCACTSRVYICSCVVCAECLVLSHVSWLLIQGHRLKHVVYAF